jgi:hypothetical protein
MIPLICDSTTIIPPFVILVESSVLRNRLLLFRLAQVWFQPTAGTVKIAQEILDPPTKTSRS